MKLSKLLPGQSLIEILLAMALLAIFLPALLIGLYSSTSGKAQQNQRIEAIALLKETEEVVRSVRENGWAAFAANGTYHPAISGNAWSFSPGVESINGFSRSLIITDVFRDANGVIVASGGTLDPSTKRVAASVTWGQPFSSSVDSILYITRYLQNTASQQTTQQEFASGSAQNVQVVNNSGGEIVLAPNTKGQWCLPSFSSSTIALPDGPPVAVFATASANIGNPNDVFVATSPTNAKSVKLAHVTVPANVDPPAPSLRGKFTLDAAQYSSPSFVPTGIGLDNSFVTNDVKYYRSSSGKLYGLLAVSKPDKEVIAILVNDGNPGNDDTNNGEYQDYVNKIYKYWTFFNTRIYQGNSSSMPNQDQTPYGYGASSLAVFEDRGYMTAGGFLYTFDLGNIDSKSTSSGLDMIGCRIEIDGRDCNVSTSRIRKYNAGNTGTNFPSEQNWLSGCNDGGNVEIFADNDVYPVRVGSNIYAYIAVGSATDPEFEIVNVTSIPTGSSSPTISSSSCGTISNGNSGWKRISSLDFNSKTNTQEASNSVYATANGTRAYISSNGGIDANNDGLPDSWQFYVINTTNKSSPAFLSGTPSSGATSGYYYGTGANTQLYPRRSLTVFNGSRALLVGKDGVSDGNNALEYHVLDINNESSPSYCGGVDFNQGLSDLTSITEADNDKFVYSVPNSGTNELKIIQGGPDGTYLDSGVYDSVIVDAGSEVVFNRLGATATVPANTDIRYQVAIADAVSGSCSGASFSYVGPDGTGNSFFGSGGGQLPFSDDGVGYENPGRCARYKAFLSTTDYNITPSVLDVHINYSL